MFTVRLNDIPELVNDQAVTIEGVLYAFDSLDALIVDSEDSLEDSQVYLVGVYAFNAASHHWYKIEARSLLYEDRPIVITGRTVVAYGHCAYMWGGWHTNPMFNGLYCFDTHSRTWSRPNVSGEVPDALFYPSACVLGHRMYVIGGYDREALGYICFLDLESLTWYRVRTSGEAPAQRACHTASAIGTRMYVWGGSVIPSMHDVYYDEVLYYLQTTTATWVRGQVQGVAPKGRICHTSFVYGRELYIFGGYIDAQCVTFADIHKYDLERSRWEEVTPNGSRPSVRFSNGCSVLGERVLIFGGFWRGFKHADEENVENEEEEHLTDLHVLHLAPTLERLSLLAVIDAALDVSCAPEFIRSEINLVTSSAS